MSVRRAKPADVGTVVDLWNEAKAWLAANGYDQWQYPVKVHNIHAAIEAGTCWIVETANGVAVATVTLDANADPSLWQLDDEPAQALYVHRLVVSRAAAGRSLGVEILDWAGLQVRAAGRRFLRLDAWTNNLRLHDYYRSLGFHLVRVVDHPSGSGALFERRVPG